MDDLDVVASGETRLASGSVLLEPLRSQILMLWSNDPDAIQRCSRLRSRRLGGLNKKCIKQRTCERCSGHSRHVSQ